jgi:SagB-type dehydrogenase family enzyme
VQTADRYRRSPGVVIQWAGPQAVCFVWQSSQRIPVTTEAIAILHGLSDWTSAAELRDRIAPGGDLTSAAETLRLLHTLGLVEREGEATAGDEWLAWTPEAAFFHFATKNGRFPEDLEQRDRELVEKAAHHPPPNPTKRVEGSRTALINSVPLEATLQRALTERRTWRSFSNQPVLAGALATVLDRTFRVQARGRVAGQGDVVVKTSPSGGSRHPIEAYVLAWNVDGLQPGAYHYDSATHELVDLRRSLSAADIPDLLAHQTYFAGASAAVIMCPVFARTIWRYSHSRAYRTVLIDAGHLGQTFCLVATALGLAPFTTMAFSESKLEALLGLDGVLECPIYVAGVGMPHAGAGTRPGAWRAVSG